MGPPCTRFRPDGAKSQTTSSAAMKYSRVAPRDGAARASSRSTTEPAAPRGRGRARKAPATQADAVRTPRVPRGADVVSPVGRIGSLLESHHPLERGGANADHAPPGKELGEGLERLPVARVVEVGTSTAASWSVMPARRSRFSRGVL